MDENEIIQIMCHFLKKQFPKTCNNCGKVYDSLYDYVKHTTHQGLPVSYDVIKGNWLPISQIGTLSFSNCQCGSTLAISSVDMDVKTLWKLMKWAKSETKKRNIKINELLADLRNKIDCKVLEDKGQENY